MNQEELGSLGSDALEQIYKLLEEVKADEVQAARGKKVARTRVRVKLSTIANLCRQARKEIEPA